MKRGKKMRKPAKFKASKPTALHKDQGKTYANIIGEVARAAKKSYKP